MPFEFKFPDVGEGIHEGEIKEILVKVGDVIKEHDVVAKIETDKAVVDIPISKGGTVLAIPHKAGDTIRVGETLVVVGEKGEKSSTRLASQKGSVVREDKSTSVVGFLPEAPPEDEEVKITKKESNVIEHSIQKVLATPAVRRLARDLEVDLSVIHATGNDGRITEEDVRKAKYGKTTESPKVQIQSKFDIYGGIEHIPLKGVRKAIAHRMVESYTKIPHVTHFDEADVTDLWKLREKEKVKAEKKGIKLTFMPFIIKACIESLKEHPSLNATLDEEHEEIVVKKYYNIGIAVDTEDGLMVPVIKEADQKTIVQIAKEIVELVDKSKNRTIDLGDLQGGTFTITNVGSAGGIFATPIINYPQSAIIALGKIHDKPVLDEKGKLGNRKFLPLSVTFDHRVLDGAEAARFTNRLKEVLEDPNELFID